MISNSKVIIDQNLCTLCGKCTKVCNSKTLEIIDHKLVQTNQILCCSCGHCAAICNSKAINANEKKSRAFGVKKISDDYTEIEKLLVSKRSVREYKTEQIDRKIIEDLIYYAEKSPSSSNTRKREYIVITDEAKILELEKAIIKKFNSLKFIANPIGIKLVGLFSNSLSKTLRLVYENNKQMNKSFILKDYPIFRNAPCVICIIAPKSGVQSKDDCIIAQQYMMLYAESKGLGSCIIGYAQYAHGLVEKLLNVKKGYSVYSVGIFGYPQYNYKNEIDYLKKVDIEWVL